MIVVLAHVRAKAGRESEFAEVLRTLIKATRTEEGCVQYDAHQATENSCAFAFYERWASKEALDAHLQSPHIAAAFATLPELAEGPPAIVTYELLEA